MKQIAHLFDGDKKSGELHENVYVVFWTGKSSKHDILLKFVKAKIKEEARSKLIET